MWHEFTEPVIIDVRGKDARRYLNNRLTADIRSLAEGQTTQAAALTPQGRIEGVFTVACLEPDAFIMAAPGGDREEVLKAVSRYRVADRVFFEELSAAYRFVSLSSSFAVKDFPAGVYTCAVDRMPGGSIDLLAPRTTALEELLKGAPGHLDREAFDALRFQANSPIFPIELNSDVILTECGMHSLISFSKGCYVGQEVIERSEAIGKLPRKLERIEFLNDGENHPSVLGPGTPIESGSAGTIGKLASYIIDKNTQTAGGFAILKRDKYHSGDAVICGGVQGKIL